MEELQVIVNHLWIGNFQAGINEANNTKSTNEEYKNTLLYRCYLGLKNYDLVIDEIPDSAAPSLLAIKLYAKYLDEPKTADTTIEKLKLLGSDSTDFVVASIYANEARFEEALRALSTSTSLEARALTVHCLLKINRVDKAAEVLAKMQQQDDDNVLTQLATAWIALVKGGEGMKEAMFIYQDLVDNLGGTPKLLNGLAICNLKINKIEEAHTLLMEALEKNPNDPETLSNLVLVSPHINPEKSQLDTARRLKQLRASSPNHSFIKSLDQFEDSFSRNAARFYAKN